MPDKPEIIVLGLNLASVFAAVFTYLVLFGFTAAGQGLVIESVDFKRNILYVRNAGRDAMIVEQCTPWMGIRSSLTAS